MSDERPDWFNMIATKRGMPPEWRWHHVEWIGDGDYADPMSKPPPLPPRNSIDSCNQSATELGARRICSWCAPHFRARLEGRSSDHTQCDDFDCGCHCQDGTRT